ncbi:hypothetical protein [Conexibacter sp. SYSU D00693]|uniref:hypothetical protein n=1 Tax=Conexibacter sp. SYSU D00693 TaxID=2812560 RepID=UPI00196ABD84|nr:hypothetical protein [Conexibacter sp. SYSU D00693]
MTTLIRLLAGAAALLVLAAIPSQAQAANCKLKSSEEYNRSAKNGPTYTRSLSVSGGASCAAGHKMIRDYYNCRVAPPSSGKAGRCTRKVNGYRCSERRSNVAKIQFDANVTCKKGRATIKHAYTQFTQRPS